MDDDDELTPADRRILELAQRHAHDVGLAHGPLAAEEAVKRVVSGARSLRLSARGWAALDALVGDVELAAACERPSRPAA